MSVPEQWSRERLLGKSVSFKGLSISDDGSSSDASKAKAGKKGDAKLDPMLWGQPGHLTESEADVYFKFKEEIEKRDPEFKDTIFSFGEIEGETWALCRWLRARKFVYEDVIKMVEEATVTRREAKAKNFYPDPKDSLGCDASMFYTQYPQLYSGFAKNGVPIFISKPGVLNVDAMECVTTLEGIVKFHWYIMMHDFKERLQAQKKKDPENFKRHECVCILDLDSLTLGQLSSRTLAIIKEQSAIDAVCFPETMNKMFIVNGPRFFTPTWKLIRGWLDPRTANKIEVISDRKSWEKKLLEHVDEHQLPVDYGGKGPNTADTLANEAYKGDLKKIHTEVLYLRGHGSVTYDVGANEELQVMIYTRCPKGAKFTVTDATTKVPSRASFVEGVEVKHNGTDDLNEYPSHKIITEKNIPGPIQVKIKADSNSGRFQTRNFLVVFSIFPKKN